jgi:hypothetical protein
MVGGKERKMNRTIVMFTRITKSIRRCGSFLLVTLPTLGLVETAQAQWTQWPTGVGGNGHYYQVVAVSEAVSWGAAQTSAVAGGGYLATITSPAENDFVYTLANAVPGAWGSTVLLEYGPWLGGFQPPGSPEPGGGWVWVSGEAFAYTNWNTATEPNNLGGVEDKLHFHAVWAPPGTWNDLQTSGEGRIFGYLVERECPPGVTCPTVSEWGLIAMGLLTVAAGAVVVLRRRRVGSA